MPGLSSITLGRSQLYGARVGVVSRSGRVLHMLPALEWGGERRFHVYDEAACFCPGPRYMPALEWGVVSDSGGVNHVIPTL